MAIQVCTNNNKLQEWREYSKYSKLVLFNKAEPNLSLSAPAKDDWLQQHEWNQQHIQMIFCETQKIPAKMNS